MTEVEKLYAYMEERGIKLSGITLGDNLGNAESVALALRDSLEAIERGEGIEWVENFDD